MKISDAKQIGYANHQKLFDQLRDLSKRKEEAAEQYRITGKECFSEEAATLELSLNDTRKAYEENQKAIDSIMEQWVAVYNTEVSKQQGDAAAEHAADIGKIMTTFRRMVHGDIVPPRDERRLMEYNEKMYQAAKNLQMLAKTTEEERKRHKSLWDDEEKEQSTDPMDIADNAEYTGNLSDVVIPETNADSGESTG